MKEKIITRTTRMLDRERKPDVIEKYNKRKEMITADVPTTELFWKVLIFNISI